MKNNITAFLIFSILVLFCVACEDSIGPVIEDEMEEIEEVVEIPKADSTLINAGCPDTLTPVYLEKDGVVLIEFESAKFEGTEWKIDSTLSGFSKKGYLYWDGSNNFGTPGKGILTFKVRISQAGTYTFTWRSRITIGTLQSEHNDSWLRIPDAKHFYGKNGDGNIVYPKGSDQEPIPESSNQSSTSPNGSSSKGWFKIYMNSVGAWTWRATTSDHDPHGIFAVFDEPGDYTVEISGRSKGHGIDKFVLFQEGIPFNNATVFTPLSQAVCE